MEEVYKISYLEAEVGKLNKKVEDQEERIKKLEIIVGKLPKKETDWEKLGWK
jgi:hypothetical protein